MAVLAQEVLVEAERKFRKADALAAEMEPHLQKLYRNSAIYGYTNARAVPPGDVLLAAALVAGISIDEKLGLNRQESEVERQVRELRGQVTQLRQEMASLRGGQAAAIVGEAAPDAKAAQSAKRRQWARQSKAAPAANQSATSQPAATRTRRT